MLETISDLLGSKKIPSLDEVQMSALLHHIFTAAHRMLRIQIAEVVYRYDHDHPRALDLFLACTLPLAEKAAKRKAYLLFFHPSDWQIELMYDGAVEAAIYVFQFNRSVRPGTDAFRRFLLRVLYHGTLRSYFMRQEYSGIRPVADVRTVRTHRKPFRNTVEQDVMTRELLEQVTNWPYLRDPVRATLQCIAALGPDAALKAHAYTASGDPDKWERQRGGRPILDPEAIAEAMGIPKRDVHRYLCQARVILRQVFNADGRLFLTH
ncbi:MAG TPA: hypothetical protein VGR84_01915 [Candidatus Acidoferrales bacterium]|nr:hypothetical protein [Candidatus Acidoferrales bacterium]